MQTEAMSIEGNLPGRRSTNRERRKKGPLARMLAKYNWRSPRLLGYLLSMDYDKLTVLTCDAWKLKCGGVPRNCYIIVKLNADAAGLAGSARRTQSFLVFARISQTTTTPVALESLSTLFEIHKLQTRVDPFTNAELQWGALEALILGTYYEKDDNSGDQPEIGFGSDVDNFLSPHFYEAYVPRKEELEMLINSSVARRQPVEIGRLRYTETEMLRQKRYVKVCISPLDFVASRSGLFGKTRLGKSNLVKLILKAMLDSDLPVAKSSSTSLANTHTRTRRPAQAYSSTIRTDALAIASARVGPSLRNAKV